MSQTATTPHNPDVGERLDVRVIPPRLKHTTIFERYHALPSGGSFTLVNDHDPRPLQLQFQADWADQYEWQYLERGPEVWRVRIGRK